MFVYGRTSLGFKYEIYLTYFNNTSVIVSLKFYSYIGLHIQNILDKI